MVRETFTLINCIKKMYPVNEFIHKRYFPDGKVFYSDKVLVETKEKGRKVAPFVVPVVGGITMDKDAYKAYEIEAPYIAPKLPITAEDLAKKAFGESPDSGRSPEDRENEVEAEHLDDLRASILRRQELMCAEILLDGEVKMKHYSSAEDAVRGEKYQLKLLRFYNGEFKNRYRFTKDFKSMTASEKIQELFKMAAILQKRNIRATDLVMTADVSMLFMSDIDFLEFFNKAKVEMGDIKSEELPDGVVCNGRININGVVMTLFTYDEFYEDLDGSIKPIFPAGTLALLHPGIGETVYGQVTLLENGGFHSYAEKVVPRLLEVEKENLIEVQSYSRPVPYPFDWDSWLVSNIYDEVVTKAVADNSVDTDEEAVDGVVLKTPEEIGAMNKKADVVAYAESIGLNGLDANIMKLEELKDAVLNYQEEVYEE